MSRTCCHDSEKHEQQCRHLFIHTLWSAEETWASSDLIASSRSQVTTYCFPNADSNCKDLSFVQEGGIVCLTGTKLTEACSTWHNSKISMVDSLQAATYSSSSQGISDADGMMKAVKSIFRDANF